MGSNPVSSLDPPLPNGSSTAPPSSDSSSASTCLVILTIPISTKLTRSNFLAWKCQIEPALHGHGLYQYLTDDPPSKHIIAAGVQLNNHAYFHWYQQDQLLLTWLRCSLSETILNQTVSCTTSAGLWRVLQQSFSASSRARLTELKRSLQTTTKGVSSCLEFCQRMRAIADELAFIGSLVSDDDLVIQILTGLGSDFNSIVAAANAKDNLGFVELQSMLLSHESLLLSQLGGGPMSLPHLENPAALFTQPQTGPRFNPRPGKGYRSHGFNSNEPSLLPTPVQRPNSYVQRPNSVPRPHYPKSSSSRPIGSNPDKNTICQICSKRGHNALNCWYRTDLSNFPEQAQSQFQAHLAQPIQANNAHTTSLSTGPEWYLDSRATHHVTNDLNNLTA